jgi:hypothetical protein
MGDMGDEFRAMKDEGQQRRRDNRDDSAELLRERGIVFEARNNGAHLMVTHAGKTVDFWPGTGKWIDRVAPPNRPAPKGRGVFKLLKHLGVSA